MNDIFEILRIYQSLDNDMRTVAMKMLAAEGMKFIHPEQQAGEIFLLNVKDNEDFGTPSFCSSVRRGNVAYQTDGVTIVPNMKPLFGVFIPTPEQPQFEIEDEVWGFRIQGTIHPDTSDPCEVWIYDMKEEPRFPRVRMCGRSMVHVLQGATAEAIKRYNEWLDKQ